MNHLQRIAFIVIFVFLGGTATCQELIPPITNYSSDIYNAASQNWDISSDKRGIIYVANNDGLLRYDGARWELFTLPNKTIIRSVFYQNKRIYTGSYEEFGFWEEDAYGALQYTSLTKLLEAGSYNNEEFWQIEAYKDGVAFRSFGKVYSYTGKDIIAIKPDFVVSGIKNISGELLVAGKNGNLYQLANNKLEPYTSASLKSGIISIAYFNEKLILGTRNDGLYTLSSKNTIVPWGNERINRFLKKNELNKIYTYDNQIVFGTIRGGVLLYDSESGTITTYYRGKGLANNTVLALHSSYGNLWLGLDNGINEIAPQQGIQYYTEKTGELGAVYDIAVKDTALYLGSNTGVHVIENGIRKFISGSQGQVWSFAQVEDQLIVNHNNGLYRVEGEQIRPISERTGSYEVKPIPGMLDTYLNATYNGLRFLKNTSDSLVVEKPADTVLKAPVNKIVFEDATNFWASHPYKGFFKLNFNASTTQITSHKIYNDYKEFEALKTDIHLIKNEIAFYNAGSWYHYDAIRDSILPFTTLKNYKNFDLIANFNDHFWFKNRTVPGLVYTNFVNDSISIVEPLLETNLIKDYENIERINDSIYLIALNDGYARLNLNAYRQQGLSKSLPTPEFRFFKAENKRLKITTTTEEIAYAQAGILNFGFATPSINDVNYYYELEEIKNTLNEGTLEFQNLPAGNYTLKVWANKNGLKSKEALICNFIILPPWYLSIAAKAIYFTLLILIIFIIYRINKHKLNAHRNEVELRLNKEQERKVQLKEREKLQEEINIKRKELANSTFQAAQRNKMLTEVKKELKDVQDKFENQNKYKAIEQKINAMVDGRDDWKAFETNFKEVNQSFFQDLLAQYPTLSSKDLKLCAYLKMNLSTKEIAPLMAISVRGVEIHRYRLRKKLKLNTSKNLSKFLIKNF